MSRILICDDEPAVRKFLRQVLEVEGHTVREVEEWKGCLEALRDQPVDLLFLDLDLPEITGEEILEGLGRGRPHVVVITGAGSDRAGKALAKHRVRILVKPFSPYEVLEALQVSLHGSSGSATS